MRYPTLRRAIFHNRELRFLPESGDEHKYSANQRQPAKHWRNINVLMFIRSGVDRPDIEHFIFVRIVEPAIGEGKTAQYDKENAAPNQRFHGDYAGG